MAKDNVPDPDDFFAETRMSFGDHIEDLRTHLFRALKGFFIAFVFSFFIGKYVLDYITTPVKEALRDFYNRRVDRVIRTIDTDTELKGLNQPTEFVQVRFLRKQLQGLVDGLPADEIEDARRPVIPNQLRRPADGGGGSFMGLWGDSPEDAEKKLRDDPFVQVISDADTITLWMSHKTPVRESALMLEAQRRVGDFDSMSTLSVQEAFVVYFKVCILCGFVLGSPWIFYQIWAFVAAGLYPHEKRYVHVFLPFSLGLFLGGVLLCELAVIPRAVEALLWFNEWLGLKPDMRLNEWLGFAILLPLVFGISFQTPLVMLFLERIGMMDADSFRKRRRIVWFIMAVFAAVLTPTPDAITMLFLWIPMGLLYELGIFMVWMWPNRSDLDIDVPDPEEMVGV